MNKTYFDKRRERINQKLKVLLSRPDFKVEIEQLRKKWSLPPEGIKDENESAKWQEWLEVETDKYFDENRSIERSKLDRLAKEKKFREREEEQKLFNQQAPLNAYHRDIEKLIDTFKLPPDWHHPLQRYLMFNESDNMWIPLNNATVQTTWDWDHGGKSQLSILINASTTIDDIKFIWPQVKRLQRRLNDKTQDKFQPIPNLDRDKRIYELAEQETSYEDIASQIKKEFKISRNFGYEDVSRALSRYRKRLGHQ